MLQLFLSPPWPLTERGNQLEPRGSHLRHALKPLVQRLALGSKVDVGTGFVGA
jgi:hypothetical protein